MKSVRINDTRFNLHGKIVGEMNDACERKQRERLERQRCRSKRKHLKVIRFLLVKRFLHFLHFLAKGRNSGEMKCSEQKAGGIHATLKHVRSMQPLINVSSAATALANYR